MRIDEKKSRCKEFIRKELTYTSYAALAIFNINIRNMKLLLQYEVQYAERIYNQKDTILGSLNAVGFIQFDVLSKIMMMIESLCALITALCTNRKKVPNGLSRYPLGMVERTQEKFEQCNNDYSKEEFMWKILSLPNVEKLVGLSKKEKKFIKNVLVETCDKFYTDLSDLFDFYLSNKIAYNKYKHGFSFITQLPYDKDKNTVIAVALERRTSRPEHEMNLICVKEPLTEKDYEWFNTLGIMKVGRQTLEKYLKISEDVDLISSYIVLNNLLYAENCGVGYLPLKVLEGRKSYEDWVYPKNRNSQITEKIKRIYSKVEPDINIDLERRSKFGLHFKDYFPEIVDKYNRYGLAVVWTKEAGETSPLVYQLGVKW